MGLFPVRADQSSPTWGHTIGLLSFQLFGTIVVSLLRPLGANFEGIVGSLLASACMAVLYTVVAERKVPGSMSGKRYKIFLALRVSAVLSLLGLLSVLFYLRLSTEASMSLTAIVVPFSISFSLYFVSVWIGLLLGAKYMERRRGKA